MVLVLEKVTFYQCRRDYKSENTVNSSVLINLSEMNSFLVKCKRPK